MELFVKKVTDFLTIFAESSMLDVLLDSECTFVIFMESNIVIH